MMFRTDQHQNGGLPCPYGQTLDDRAWFLPQALSAGAWTLLDFLVDVQETSGLFRSVVCHHVFIT